MTSGQWCFPPKVGVDGEHVSKKSLSPKIYTWGTALLLTTHCLALPNVQSLQGLIVPVTWIPRPLVVDLVMASDGWPNSTWRLLMFLLSKAVSDTALLSTEAPRKSSPATQSLQVLIQQFSTNDVIKLITWNFVALEEFACYGKQIWTCHREKLPVPLCWLDALLLVACPFL